jgi:hypothetical protein
MMGYIYTEVDRLEKPHRYEYTPYLGVKFIDAYFRDRLKNIRRFRLNDRKSYQDKIDLYFFRESERQFEAVLDNAFFQVDKSWRLLVDWEGRSISQKGASTSINKKIGVVSSFDIGIEINTEKLLSSLIFGQLSIKDEEITKEWLDRLVQRFEVTKKLYESYLPGFRKGKGRSNKVYLYWLFSLSLILYYTSTTNIKYLSTSLKVSDLLCSLSNDALIGKVPLQGLCLTLAVEFLNIKLLSHNILGGDI